MFKYIALIALVALAGCQHGNAHIDYTADSFTHGVNACHHNTFLRCR